MSEVEGAAGATTLFDPAALRAFSLLPDEDADEAYCVRHDCEMRQIDPLVHHDGGVYTTAERFSVYTCPQCLDELPADGVKAYQYNLATAFDRWDEGDAEGDWFQYVGEARGCVS